MAESMITITKKEYYSLKCSEAKLEMLENAGVDNWDWYGDALNPDDEPTYWDIQEQLMIEVFGEE